ncbi:scavenger receptor cysteine-rich type 1 protein M130-like [Triplophysa dalaica]|uniref:scavenger receptor cysteine-rich type 1 protein M130-like n=1 Tax=Triplophysa dalaica TaxID=1582913 RepID=UPI0024DF810C|nr:scavenger receptor cysteine-rich type 1 protein M130-like [Triplophysa dalaica]
MEICLTLILLSSVVMTITAFSYESDVNVRLVNGDSRCSGRVEVFHDGQWGTVCDDHFDLTDADVVCRELGCGQAVDVARFGQGSGQILMDGVSCSGSEFTLKNCTSRGWVNQNSVHAEDAGVICSETSTYGRFARLADGPHLCSGRVELLRGDTWMSVCDAAFDDQDAEVVCRELNCGVPVQRLGADVFGEGEGHVWTQDIQCRGNESHIRSCSSSALTKTTCSHDKDLGLTCSGFSDFRMVNGSDICSGRVERQYFSKWGTVCDGCMNMRAASVVCRQLNCGIALSVVGVDWFGEGSGEIWADVFDCQGNETQLSQCSVSSWSRAEYSHKQDVGVICSNSSLGHNETMLLSGERECEETVTFHGERSTRLVGSGGVCAGRLEVFHKGSWGTVCDDSWDIKDAHVVCRQLQCGVALSDQPVPAWFGPGSGPIWLDDVNCEGNETSLWNCSSLVWGDHDCNHKEDVGVVCSEFKEIRLSEGCEGNVEVFYNGSWGNVCWNQMNRDTASLICQELNCGRSASEPSSSDGLRSWNWLDELKCRSHDSTLWECPSKAWGQNKCEGEAAKFNCSVREEAVHDVPRSRLTCSTSPSPHQRQCSSHIPLRLSGGKGRCSGRLEVYHNSEWGSVCDDLWDIRDAQVVCRQLGCGAALSADGNEAFGAGEAVVWLNRVECRGTEIYLWDCPHVLKNHTDCSHKEHVELICTDLSVSTTPATTTATTTTTFLSQTNKSPVTSQTPPSESLFIPPVVVIVLGVLLLLLLVPLLILIKHNRVMRRALSKRRHWTQTEAVYEEIEPRHKNRHKHFSQRGSLISEEQYSGYEDVEDDFLSDKKYNIEYYDDVISDGDPKEEMVKKVQAEYYDDVITDGLKADSETENTVENYDDVINTGQNSDLEKDTLDNYDDVINGQNFQDLIGVHEEYDDVKNDREDVTNVLDYYDVGEESHNVGQATWAHDGSRRCSSPLYMEGGVSYISADVLLILMTIAADVNVRLVNGDSSCAGRVEVLHDGQWGTVCDLDHWNQWDLTDAAVVCRELGCGDAVDVARFGPGSEPIKMAYVQCSGSESTLKNCKFLNGAIQLCSHAADVGVTCSGVTQYVRSSLVAGSHLCSGRVEMYYGGRWGTVCDAAFDDQDAEVVCRELNCGVPVQRLGADAFGEGEGHVWTQDIQCRGNELSILHCSSTPSHYDNSNHDNDVGLICLGYTDFRLVNGSDFCSGRVESRYLTEWRTVCDGCMNIRAASVVCRQLNCGIALSVVEVDWFGEGSGEIWADVFDCQGNETQLSQCSISSWSRAEYSHKQDVGVICSHSSLSLHDGGVRMSGERECEGELEVYIDQVWRRVLLDSWSVTESSVVCRQLGCGSVLNFSGSSSSSAEHSHECVMGFKCSGTEHHLRNCISSTQTLNCSSTQHLSITCLGERSIRLVGSGGDCAGRLEVFHKGSWGTVCDDSWDIKDAHVVCRQLQCGVALSDQPVPAWFGPGSGPIWLDDVNCEGNETSLWNCSSRVWGDHDCNHKEDVGVVCSEFKEIRLSEGCKGNVEVFYNGSWGNVCYNQMDRNTASLICQELNCGRSASEPSFTDGLRSQNWLDYFKCRSHDTTLWQSPSKAWAQNNCEGEAAKFDCSVREEVVHDVPRSRLTCSTSPSPHQRQCSSHVPLRLSGGKGRCSGRLEVYYNSEWGSVCDDLWDIRDAQVVCRQLGCGAALSADGNEAFGAGEGVVWLNRVECRGTEIHLWDCPHVLKKHTDCSHKEHVELICADLSAPTTSAATTTTASHSVSQTIRSPVSSTLVTRAQTLPSSSTLFISPVVVIVLGVLLLLLLVLLLLLLVSLLMLIQHNRLMRKGTEVHTSYTDLFKRIHWTQTDAFYEEIDHRHTNRLNHVAERGSLISEEQHSGYEDAEKLLSVQEEKTEYYDDVTNRSDLREEMVKKAEYYDVITEGLKTYSETEDNLEMYDDVISTGQNSSPQSGGVQEDDDVKNVCEDVRILLADDMGEEPNKVGGAV